MIDTVFLDAGGVLVFPNWTRVSHALSARGIDVSPSALAAAEPFIKREIDVAHTIAATDDKSRGWMYFDLILARLGITPDRQTAEALAELYEYHQQANLWEYVPDGVRRALGELRETGVRMVVVSNANGKLGDLFDRVGLSQYFDCLLDSFVEGVEKPDPKLFEIALTRAGATAERTLHVGDLYHVDVAGARAAGLATVLLDIADLYADCDCPRIRSLAELPALVTSFRTSGRPEGRP